MTSRISSPAELLASVPACPGFVPTESVLVLGLRTTARGNELTCVCRADVPRTSAEATAMVDTLVARLLSAPPRCEQATSP